MIVFGLVSSIFDLLTFTALLWTTVAATVFALAVPFFGSWSRLFGFVPLSTVEMGTVVGIVTA
jgi:hypothetical protein